MSADHHRSHRELLPDAHTGRSRPVDAVIVPAGRPATQLLHAAQLAADLPCRLLVMRSPSGDDLVPFAEQAAIRWPDLEWRHLVVPEAFTHPLLPATASPTSDSRDWRHGPLSTMRNLALLMARMVGWQTVLLLDDDITGLCARTVLRAAGGLERAAAVGFSVNWYPDNSVVCHANRLAGNRQGVFVGASALVVDVSREFGFFPNIYNEDWLFLYDGLRSRRISRFGQARQLEYDPFADPGRAAAEEFGEIIAEGLIAGLYTPSHRVLIPVDVGYWEEFLKTRQTYLERIAGRLARSVSTAARRRALESLAAADERRLTVTPENCTHYVRSWRADLLRWRDDLAGLPTPVSFDTAAAYLGLATNVVGLIA
jgi:hypothetical protein